MKYFELAYNTPSGFRRNDFYPTTDKVNKLEELRLLCPSDTDIYCSVYDYESDVEVSSSTDFASLKKYGDFYLDFDGDSAKLSEVKDEVDAVLAHLVDRYNLDRDYMPVYFSGGKGYHVLVPEDYFHIEDRTRLHEIYKEFALQLKSRLGLKYLDTVVYDARRVFRVAGTYNVKGGETKELIEGDDPENIPRSLIGKSIHMTTPVILPKTNLEQVSSVGTIKKPLESFFLRLLNSKVQNGKWNNTIYSMSLYLKDHGYAEDEAYKLLVESVIGKPEKQEDFERTRKTVESAYASNKHFGLTNNELMTEHMTDDERIKYGVDDITSLLVPWKEVMTSTRDQIEKFKKKQMLSYGIEPLDKYLGMVQATELVIVGGTSGIGKSEFVWNIAKANAKLGIPVAFIGLEMTPEQYALRTVRNRVGLDSNKFKTMDLSDDEKKQVSSALTGLEDENLPIYFFNPKHKLDVTKLEKLIVAATERFGIKLWVIDHLHYFPSYSTKEEQTSAIANIVTSIKQMTLKYELPIILVSHYRKLSSGVSPSLNSFKDSITIPQVADTVLALNRDLISPELGIQRRIEISILKSRYGMPSATFFANFNPQSGEYTPTTDFRYGLNGSIFD